MASPTKEQKRAEYMKHREKYLTRARKWAQDNPDRRREAVNRYNAKAAEKKRRWHDIKRYGQVVERTECERCGDKPDDRYLLVIHHKDGNNGKLGKPLNNARANLGVLCRRCHPKVHYRGCIRETMI